jgi:predicted phage terminase large subunit-like protein
MQTLSVSRAAAARELLRRRRARGSLVAYANAIEVPGRPVGDDPEAWLFQPVETSVAAHHRLLLEAFERTTQRRHGRLMVFMPPGSAKSTYCSVVAPTAYMGATPDRRVILASYGSDLARRHGRRSRQVVQQPAYSGIWGGHGRNPEKVSMSPATFAADEWALTNGSEYLAGGILSGITGNRAHGIVIDDPVRGREQADSKTIREKTWDAYNDDLLTRLIPGGWVVLVQTRWHEDDLAGRLLPKGYDGRSGMIECTDGKAWEVVNLPAQCERDDDPLGRKVGEYLWPEWFDEAHWSIFRQQARTWAALYQQRPRPEEGSVFKRAWIRERWRVIPDGAATVVHSWDTAQKEGQLNDYTVNTAWALGRGAPGYYLRDVVRERMEYPALKRRVMTLAERDRPVAVLIEDKGSGASLIQELRSTTRLPIIAIMPEQSKLFRANEVSPTVEAGRMILPESAPWLADYESELFSFPLAAYDDQVDSTTQFLRWVQGWGGGTVESVGAGLTRTIADAIGPGSEVGEGYGSIGGGSDMDGFE